MAPPVINWLLRAFGWRQALVMLGSAILVILYPVGWWVTRSSPADLNLFPDGADWPAAELPKRTNTSWESIHKAMRDRNFWLLTVGSALVIGSMNSVIQHLIFFLESRGYSSTSAARYLSILLTASLAGRVIVGFIADRLQKKTAMAAFYLMLGAAIPLLYLAHQPLFALAFVAMFGFSMGADYMLIPLVTAECFGLFALGRILSLVIMGYSVGQWVAPWITGQIYDRFHSYDSAWKLMSGAALVGACAIYLIRPHFTDPSY